MRTKIFYEKVVSDAGERYIVIKKFENVLPYEELPRLYLRMKPCYYGFIDEDQTTAVRVIDEDGEKEYYYVGGISRETFDRLIKTMKKAGENLIKARKELEEEKRKWHGEGCVEI